MTCPFCGLDPYEYVDVGVGGRGVAVAVNCCEFGTFLFDRRYITKEHAEKAESIAADIEAGLLTREAGRDAMQAFLSGDK